MVGAVNEPDLHEPIPRERLRRYCEYPYTANLLVDAARAGFEIPRLRPPEWALDYVRRYLQGERPVVITLRESRSQQARNSRLNEWIKFAETIQKDFPVLIVRDTHTANWPLGKWRTRASTDSSIRAALYHLSFCNLAVSNGPNTFCQYGRAPYLLFKQLIDDVALRYQASEWSWWRMQRLRKGEQWPWSSPLQRLTWKDDSHENIAEEFATFCAMPQAATPRVSPGVGPTYI